MLFLVPWAPRGAMSSWGAPGAMGEVKGSGHSVGARGAGGHLRRRVAGGVPMFSGSRACRGQEAGSAAEPKFQHPARASGFRRVS